MPIKPQEPQTVPYNTPGVQTTGAPPWMQQSQQSKFSTAASPVLGQKAGEPTLGGGPATPTGGGTPGSPPVKTGEAPKPPEVSGSPSMGRDTPQPGTFSVPIEGGAPPQSTTTAPPNPSISNWPNQLPGGWEQWAQWFQQIMSGFPGMGYGNPWMQGGGYGGGGWGMPGAWGYQPPGYGGYPSQSWPTIGYNPSGYYGGQWPTAGVGGGGWTWPWEIAYQRQGQPSMNASTPAQSSSTPSGNTMEDRKKKLPPSGTMER